MDNTFRQLKADKLIETAERLVKRIGNRFPPSNLSKVASAVVDLTREAVARAEEIQRPNWPIRIGVGALGAVVLAGLIVVGVQLNHDDQPLKRVMEFMRLTQGAVVYFGVVFLFFWTLETRLKRAKVVKAVHELRAVAHIIDMHQLTKDPERVGEPPDPGNTDGPMTAEAVSQYLTYCTEMLAIISKVGQLYVQDFPDGTALAAVDQFENLATGLSQKIWQKIMILDRIQSAEEECQAPAPAPAAAPPEQVVEARKT